MSTAIILDAPTDWKYWIAEIKGEAEQLGIWRYMDPDRETVPSLPDEPSLPDFSDIQQGATSYRTLSPENQTIYNYERNDWAIRMQNYKDVRSAYYSVSKMIQSTVSTKHRVQIVEKPTVHEKLRTLSARFASHPFANRLRLYNRWKELITNAPHSQALPQWLDEWSNFMVEAKGSDSSSLRQKEGEEANIFFLSALHSQMPDLTDHWMQKVQEKPDIPLEEIIQSVQVRIQSNKLNPGPGPGPGSGAAFATLGDMQSQSTKKPSDCPCGEKHYFSQCPYVIEKIRKPDWQPKPEIQQKFKDIRKNSPKLLAAINRARKIAGLDDWKEHDEEDGDAKEVHFALAGSEIQGVFSIPKVSMPSQPIPTFEKDTYILDSGATTHVCNDRRRFTEFKPIKGWLPHGDSGMWIKGRGQIMIYPRKPESQQHTQICLGDVIYCPDFHLNIVSYSRLHKHHLFWNPEHGTLRMHGQDVCSVHEHGDLFVLERNEPKKPLPLSLPQSSMMPWLPTRQPEGVNQPDPPMHFVGHVGPMALRGFGQLHPRPDRHVPSQALRGCVGLDYHYSL